MNPENTSHILPSNSLWEGSSEPHSKFPAPAPIEEKTLPELFFKTALEREHLLFSASRDPEDGLWATSSWKEAGETAALYAWLFSQVLKAELGDIYWLDALPSLQTTISMYALLSCGCTLYCPAVYYPTRDFGAKKEEYPANLAVKRLTNEDLQALLREKPSGPPGAFPDWISYAQSLHGSLTPDLPAFYFLAEQGSSFCSHREALAAIDDVLLSGLLENATGVMLTLPLYHPLCQISIHGVSALGGNLLFLSEEAFIEVCDGKSYQSLIRDCREAKPRLFIANAELVSELCRAAHLAHNPFLKLAFCSHRNSWPLPSTIRCFLGRRAREAFLGQRLSTVVSAWSPGTCELAAESLSLLGISYLSSLWPETALGPLFSCTSRWEKPLSLGRRFPHTEVLLEHTALRWKRTHFATDWQTFPGAFYLDEDGFLFPKKL